MDLENRETAEKKYEVLRRYFGYTAFRNGQETIVDALLAASLERDEDWIAADLAPLAAGQDPRWAALVTAAAELSRPRPALGAEHVAALREQGLDETQIADALSAAGFFAWANRLMLSLGEPSLPDA